MRTVHSFIYTLSLHDALPILKGPSTNFWSLKFGIRAWWAMTKIISFLFLARSISSRSEEHTSELQSRGHLVCRLLLEKKKRIVSLLQHTRHHLLQERVTTIVE